ncbi:CRISPR-associated endonuclease Cas1 [Thermogemmatispora sp.]|uniref:CRISPR-associated endonuclease Cas1 n=1 Tax=Thermogemmatispora sp. TaxID=1968838 RepID=UPI0035E46291
MYRRRTVIIGGYGTVLRVRHDALEMFPGIASARDLVNRVPVRLDRGVHGIEQVIIFQESRGSVSLDALSWLQEQGIAVSIIDYRGRLVSQLTAGGTGRVELHDGQWYLTHDETARLPIIRSLVNAKLLRQADTLDDLSSLFSSPVQGRVREYATQLRAYCRWFDVPDSGPVSSPSRLMLVEGRAARGYWEFLAHLPVRFTPPSYARTLPAHWLVVGPRHSPVRAMRTAQSATSPVQALLNYGYALLESRIRLSIQASGLNPAIPVFHALRDGRDSLVFDLMEPFRPRLDQVLISWVMQHQPYRKGDFLQDREGSIRINPVLLRVVARELVRVMETWHAEIDEWCTRLTDLALTMRRLVHHAERRVTAR